MLRDEDEKKNQFIQGQNKLESTYLTYKTRDPDHETVITPQKKNTEATIKCNSQSTQY